MAGLSAALYVASYFALARRGLTFQHGGSWASSPEYRGLPDYRGLPEIAFRPLHRLDRTVLRPRFWQGEYSAAEKAARARTIMQILGEDLKQESKQQ